MAQATKLKKEQENLLRQQWELGLLEEERKNMEEYRKKAELGYLLGQVWIFPRQNGNTHSKTLDVICFLSCADVS